MNKIIKKFSNNIKNILGIKPDLYNFVLNSKTFPTIKEINNYNLLDLQKSNCKLFSHCVSEFNKGQLNLTENQWKFLVETSYNSIVTQNILDRLVKKADIDRIKIRKFPNIFWEHLFFNSNLNFLAQTPLSIYFKYKKVLNCNLTDNQLIKLIKSTNLNTKSLEGYSSYHYALKYNKENQLNLTPEMFELLRDGAPYNLDIHYYTNMHLSQQFITELPSFSKNDLDIFYNRFVKEKYLFDNNLYYKEIFQVIEKLNEKYLLEETNKMSIGDDFFKNIKMKRKKIIKL